MQIAETFNVGTSTKELYEFFLDAQTVGRCVPGCEGVDKINESEYDSIIQTKVGAISAKFKVRTRISEAVPFNLIRTEGKGKELRNLGHFNQKTEIHLKALSASETEVSYTADVSIVGRLGTFGDRIMKSKAKTLGKEFADSVRLALGDETVHGTGHETVRVTDLPPPEEGAWRRMVRFITDMVARIFKSNKDV